MAEAQSRMKEAALATARFARLALVLGVVGCASTSAPSRYKLSDIQGVWWSDCDAPHAEVLVDHDQYVGVFEGRHRLTLEGDVVTFESGWPSHAYDLSGEPRSFRIVEATGTTLVLAPINGSHSRPLRLVACEETPPG